MKANSLRIAALAAALVLSAGCAKKKPAQLPPAPVGADGTGADTGAGTGAGTGTVGSAALPGSRADFLQNVSADRVYFETDSYSIDAEDRSVLDSQAAWLQRNATVRVTIEGHADERGTREYNLALGDRRANAAKNYLASRGIDSSRMTVISWGKERPVAEGSDESAWAQNRRAVTVLLRLLPMPGRSLRCQSFVEQPRQPQAAAGDLAPATGMRRRVVASSITGRTAGTAAHGSCHDAAIGEFAAGFPGFPAPVGDGAEPHRRPLGRSDFAENADGAARRVGDAPLGDPPVPGAVKIRPPGNHPVCHREPVAAEVAAVAGMKRHVKVADEMGEERERLHPFPCRQRLVGEQLGVALDLRGDAIAVAAGGGEVERLADVDILVMPGRA
jgi:peptidoglycan-associated lipoprotein